MHDVGETTPLFAHVPAVAKVESNHTAAEEVSKNKIYTDVGNKHHLVLPLTSQAHHSR